MQMLTLVFMFNQIIDNNLLQVYSRNYWQSSDLWQQNFRIRRFCQNKTEILITLCQLWCSSLEEQMLEELFSIIVRHPALMFIVLHSWGKKDAPGDFFFFFFLNQKVKGQIQVTPKLFTLKPEAKEKDPLELCSEFLQTSAALFLSSWVQNQTQLSQFGWS